MQKRTLAFVAGGTLCVFLFAFAFVAAPHSCEWGLSAYFWTGVAGVLVLFALLSSSSWFQTWSMRTRRSRLS